MEGQYMRYQKFQREALRDQCRECINRTYGLKLARKDCRYWFYPVVCHCCGETRNVVVEIEPFSRWKIWLAKKQEADTTVGLS